MDSFTKEELEFFAAAPMTPLRRAINRVSAVAKEEIRLAKLSLITTVEQLNEKDDGEGPLFPPEVVAQIDPIREKLLAFGENGLAAYRFSINAPYDLSALQARGRGTNADTEPPPRYCDYRVVGGSNREEDIVRIPIYVRDALADTYAGPSEIAGKTIAQWLQTKPYAFQRDYGIRAMRELGIIK